MKYLIPLFILAIVIAGCSISFNTVDKKNANTEQKGTVIRDTTPKVTGIGGIMFTSKNPKATMDWYGKNLGLAIDAWGSPFEFRNANRPDEINYLIWSPQKEGTDIFKSYNKDFIINYRVQNIEGLIKMFKANGVNILDTLQTYDYGKFISIMDPEGNKIELWEPVDSVMTKMGEKTTK
jgi:predicted enzyme related to lactoylglutathione lyase